MSGKTRNKFGFTSDEQSLINFMQGVSQPITYWYNVMETWANNPSQDYTAYMTLEDVMTRFQNFPIEEGFHGITWTHDLYRLSVHFSTSEYESDGMTYSANYTENIPFTAFAQDGRIKVTTTADYVQGPDYDTFYGKATAILSYKVYSKVDFWLALRSFQLITHEAAMVKIQHIKADYERQEAERMKTDKEQGRHYKLSNGVTAVFWQHDGMTYFQSSVMGDPEETGYHLIEGAIRHYCDVWDSIGLTYTLTEENRYASEGLTYKGKILDEPFKVRVVKGFMVFTFGFTGNTDREDQAEIMGQADKLSKTEVIVTQSEFWRKLFEYGFMTMDEYNKFKPTN